MAMVPTSQPSGLVYWRLGEGGGLGAGAAHGGMELICLGLRTFVCEPALGPADIRAL